MIAFLLTIAWVTSLTTLCAISFCLEEDLRCSPAIFGLIPPLDMVELTDLFFYARSKAYSKVDKLFFPSSFSARCSDIY